LSHCVERVKMSESQIFVIGNANVDLTSYVPHAPESGETVLGTDFTIGMGGKGANQAVAAARAGGPVAFVGRIGTDSFGAMVQESLSSEGLDLTHLGVQEGKTGVANIYVDQTGANRIAVYPGASGTIDAGVVGRELGGLSARDFLVSQLEISQEAVSAALSLGFQAGATTVLNIAPYAPLLPGILAHTTWLIANEIEIADLLRNIDLHRAPENITSENVRENISRWASDIGCNLIVTLGDAGAIGCTLDEPAFAFQPEPREAVDTVGAGDCFVGFFVAFLREGLSWRQALVGGVLAASDSVQHLGAQESYPSQSQSRAVKQQAQTIAS
jgi:ribokinase